MHRNQFIYEERCCIAQIIEENPLVSYAAIGRLLNRSRNAVREEVLRNSRSDGRYLACHAQELAEKRKHQPRGAYKKDNPRILDAIERGLEDKLSPKLISNALKAKYPEDPSSQASYQTIYEIVWEDKAYGGTLYQGLPHGSSKRRKRYGTAEKRGQIPGRTSIDKRPEDANNKIRIGDLEGDTIEGCKGGGGLASFVDRKTQYLLLEPLKNGTAEELNRAASRAFMRHAHVPRLTLTLDNGKEFSAHKELSEKLGVDIYFAHPYSPWERGLNEQVNGMVRWWFPKGTNFLRVPKSEIRRVERLLNRRPRERLGYRTPSEVMDHAVLLQI
jgi:transposase, IS30 family